MSVCRFLKIIFDSFLILGSYTIYQSACRPAKSDSGPWLFRVSLTGSYLHTLHINNKEAKVDPEAQGNTCSPCPPLLNTDLGFGQNGPNPDKVLKPVLFHRSPFRIRGGFRGSQTGPIVLPAPASPPASV